MNRLVQRGSTDVSAWVQLLDSNGDYVTGLTYSDVTITARRFLGGRLVSEISITPAALTAIDDAHSDGGFVEDSSRKRYRVDLTDACVATGLDSADKVELKVTASGVVGNTSEELTLVNFLPWQTTGERTITVHVTNASGGADLAGCSVTIKDSADLVKGKVDATDANGEGEVYVNDGPYTVIVSRDGFITKGQAVTVSGDATVEIELAALAPTPSGVGYVTGYLYTDVDGVRTGNIAVTLTIVGRPTSGNNTTGLAVDDNRTITSDVDGYAEWTNLVPGAKYRVSYAGVTVDTTIPADATGAVALNTIVGSGA